MTTVAHSGQEVRETAARSLKRSADMIRANIMVSDAWAIRALLAIYSRQTSDEKANGQTRYENSVGFSGVDAEILSSFAEQVIRNRAAGVRVLSDRQFEILRPRIARYSGQLARFIRSQESS